MTKNIEVSHKYNGITLTCDEPSFHRLFEALSADFLAGTALNELSSRDDVRYVTIRLPDEPTSPGRYHWAVWVPAITAGITSVMATFIGFWVIAQWFLRVID